MIQNPLMFSAPVIPTCFCEQTLTFRVETVGQPDRRHSMGLHAEEQNGCKCLRWKQAVCVSTNGAALVNGKEMTEPSLLDPLSHLTLKPCL